MAENRGVWGIDIGQAGLKAICLQYAESAEQVIAVAFDYVPHPKLLSQPDAIPEELIPQALETFLSRNEIGNNDVAISVPGQSALTRFIQLPPVEAGKVSEIIKYEARQQIPFALEDVIWDYQTLSGGKQESGYLLGAEVGLFAMKREQVAYNLRPFVNAKVEVDLIQIAPLALYNFLVYDQLGLRLGDDEVEARNEFTILLDMGADNTTLLVSNGQKIWIRNVPIGGNHFTRALTKDMKLTFAKAEHLKCNATKAEDPRAVFQALRPVFNDYVSEIQRSIGYFSSVNRDAKISKVVGLGNGFKLAGLQKFLQQNLQYDVERIDSFQAVVGDGVLGAPLFAENIQSFAVPYGLALQQLNLTPIHTSLLPPEIATMRKIRRKKPWAVAVAAALLMVVGISAAGYSNVLQSVHAERFGPAIDTSKALKAKVDNHKAQYATAVTDFKKLVDDGRKLIKPLDARESWLNLYKAVNECLPRDPTGIDPETIDIGKRKRIKITGLTAERTPEVGMWFAMFPPNDTALEDMRQEDLDHPPRGPGLIVTLTGVHYNNDRHFLTKTLLDDLQQQWMKNNVPVRLLGITHATLKLENSQEVLYDPLTGEIWGGAAYGGLLGGGGEEGMAGGPMGMQRRPSMRKGRRGLGFGTRSRGMPRRSSMRGGGGLGGGGGEEGMGGGSIGPPRGTQRRSSMSRRGGLGGGGGEEGMGGGSIGPPRGTQRRSSMSRRGGLGGGGEEGMGLPMGPRRAGGSNMMRKPGLLDSLPYPNQDTDYPEPQYLEETRFVIEFVWRETSPEKLQAFAKLHELFEKDEETTAAKAREKYPTITITDDDFTAYLVMHRPPEAPAGDIVADADADTTDSGGRVTITEKKGEYTGDYNVRSD